MKISYNWLKWYIPDVPEADKLKDILTYHLTEVESVEKVGDDTIFNINILPNRAHDLLSHQGVAREIAGQLGIAYQDPTSKYKVPPLRQGLAGQEELQHTNLKIELRHSACRRYSARIIRGIKVGPSPDWVVAHLASIGERSINNIVDATNIVMHDCGQPTHAYDMRKVVSSKEKVVSIRITNAKEGDELALVGRDKIVAKLKDTDIIIANSSGETLALAGVKGGINSGIAEDTTDILIEVANFDPVSVRKTARRIGVLSDAAKRFENDLSPEQCSFGMLELTALFMEMFPDAVYEEVVDIYPNKQTERVISFSTEFVNKKLGSQMNDIYIEEILKNYNFQYTRKDSNFEVFIPKLRLDLEQPEDMVEEIGRVYGYDKVIPTIPHLKFKPNINKVQDTINSIRTDLVNKGYREVMTYSFTKKGDVQVARGTKGKDFLRTNLSDGLKESYEMNRLNVPILGINDVKIFEIGTVFINNNEELHVAYADKSGIKEMKLEEYPTSENISDHKRFPDSAKNSGEALFKMWSPYPFITRDISVWLPVENSQIELENIYKNCGGELLLHNPRLVDKFEKNGKVSYAYRLVFQAKDRTLKDEEVNDVINSINKEISKNIYWIIR